MSVSNPDIYAYVIYVSLFSRWNMCGVAMVFLKYILYFINMS